MIVTNKKTGEDVSGHYLNLMQGKITNKEFEMLAGIKNSYENRINWLEKNDYQESDIMIDTYSREYVLADSDNGSPNEDGYQVKKEKVYLDY